MINVYEEEAFQKAKRQHEINTGIPSNGLLPRRNVMEQKTITIFGSGSLSATDKANIISPKNYSWTPSEKEVPNDNRTIFIVKDKCHFIGFYEGGKFWLSSQNGVPINKRLKSTEIKQPLHWIDYPEDNSP